MRLVYCRNRCLDTRFFIPVVGRDEWSRGREQNTGSSANRKLIARVLLLLASLKIFILGSLAP
jgi:hypothetical protein